MEAEQVVRELGGVVRRHALLEHIDRPDLDRALAAGAILRDSRGLYHLPDADDLAILRARCGGVLSLTSAALHHGWSVVSLPDRPHLTVSRGRKGVGDLSARLHFAELRPDQVRDGVLTPEATLDHCLRLLPYAEALAVADSALREGYDPRRLRRVAADARGPGSLQARRVAAAATGRAANPFESAARAICHAVPGLQVVPQFAIADDDFHARVDLADRRLGVAIEADSFTWHGNRSALASDARRYNRLVVLGWLVLRLCWEDVMHHPDDVRRMLVRAVALCEQRLAS